MRSSNQRGSAIIMLFIAVALFGMISYVFLQGSRGNTGMIKSEADKAAAVQSQDCANALSLATKRLNARGCQGMISMNLDGSNAIAGAPKDGSCSMFHPNGGGVKNCANTAVTGCTKPQLEALQLGEVCGGILYAGMLGDRMYAHVADESSNITWNNGSAGSVVTSVSSSDGKNNTTALVARSDSHAPYAAAALCRSYGPDWYLPSALEMGVIEISAGDIGGFSSMNYWVSEENDGTSAYVFMLGSSGFTPTLKTDQAGVRCLYKP